MIAINSKISRKLSVILAEVQNHKRAAERERSIEREAKTLGLIIQAVIWVAMLGCFSYMRLAKDRKEERERQKREEGQVRRSETWRET